MQRSDEFLALGGREVASSLVGQERRIMEAVSRESVSFVNLESRMEQRGIEVVLRRRSRGDYPCMVEVTLDGGGVGPDSLSLAGALFSDGEPRIVCFGRIPLEFRPYGRLLVVRTEDTLGVLGKIGSLLGEEEINIAEIHLARRDGEDDAWTVLRLDEMPGPRALRRLEEFPEMRRALVVQLGPAPAAPAGSAAEPNAASGSTLTPQNGSNHLQVTESQP